MPTKLHELIRREEFTCFDKKITSTRLHVFWNALKIIFINVSLLIQMKDAITLYHHLDFGHNLLNDYVAFDWLSAM